MKIERVGGDDIGVKLRITARQDLDTVVLTFAHPSGGDMVFTVDRSDWSKAIARPGEVIDARFIVKTAKPRLA